MGGLIMRPLLVGELKKELENVPDDLIVKLVSDSGVDQGVGTIVVEGAHRVNYQIPDTPIMVDYFAISANDYEEDLEEES
jgi:hypothetical protein